MTKHLSSKVGSWQVFGSGLFVLVIAGLPVLAYFGHLPPWILIPFALFYIVTAWVLKSRVMICLLAGIVFGLLAVDTKMSNKSEQYQLWQPVWSLSAGAVIGLAVGFLWDRGAGLSEPVRPGKKQKR